MSGRWKKLKTGGSSGFSQQAEPRSPFGGILQGAEAKPPHGESSLFGSSAPGGGLFGAAPSTGFGGSGFGFGSSTSGGLFGAPAQQPFQAKATEGGLGGGLFSNNSGNGTPIVKSGAAGTNGFNFGVPSNEIRITNKNIRIARRCTSLVYKCNACGLCFDRPEVMFKHFSNCFPSKKITRIHCICGLEFDKNNYDYHCEVHRKFSLLKKKNITINDDENIDVEGMAEKFMHESKQATVSAAEEEYTSNANADDKQTSIFANNEKKSFVIYRCKCKLCFERPEFLFKHVNICDPDEKITRILCMCGLAFDKHNYDYHCEVHRKFGVLHVKKITINGDEIIHISEMWQEFAKDDEIKDDKGTKEAQVQTVDLKPVVKSPEEGFKGNGTFEQLLGNKVLRAVIDTIGSGIDGEESQTKITIIISKSSEKTVECPDEANTGDKNNEVTEIRTSETSASQKAADNTTNYISAPIEEVHDSTNNHDHEALNIAPNENTAPTIPENKTVDNLKPKDCGKFFIIEPIDRPNKINVNVENSDISTNEISALTPSILDNKTMDNPEPQDNGTNNNIELKDRPNQMNDNQENSDISINEISAPTPPMLENKAIDNPEPHDNEINDDIEPKHRTNQMNDNQENSDISTNEISAPISPILENKAMDNPEPHDNETNNNIEPKDRTNQMNDNQENSEIPTNETSALTPTIPENKTIDNHGPKDNITNDNTETIDQPNN